jgi:hypothetical protein
MAVKFLDRLLDWYFWIVATIFLIFVADASFGLGLSWWFFKRIWGKNADKVAHIELWACIVLSVVIAASVILGPKIHRLIYRRKENADRK